MNANAEFPRDGERPMTNQATHSIAFHHQEEGIWRRRADAEGGSKSSGGRSAAAWRWVGFGITSRTPEAVLARRHPCGNRSDWESEAGAQTEKFSLMPSALERD